jgi:hypothetical protein
VPAGTAVGLVDAAGAPVPDIEGDPVTAPVSSTGSFSARSEIVDLATLAIALSPVVVPVVPVVTPVVAADPELAATGTTPGAVLAGAIGFVLIGSVLFGSTTARARRRRAL